MHQLFKEQSLKDLVRYNQWLLIICACLAVAVTLLSFKALHKSERWVLIPANNVDNHLSVSSKAYSEAYLREWAMYVMGMLMTTSYDTVAKQVADLKTIASSNPAMEDFFKKHLQFVRGSNIQAVFFPKQVAFKPKGVNVSGTFRYWLGSSEKVITQEKTYHLQYKQGPHGVLLLEHVAEVLE